MKTLVIPDIHNRVDGIEDLILIENPDKTVFLGDYFDSINDSLEITHRTATWLKYSLMQKDRIHLMGNHDLSYINDNYQCSGYSEGKFWAISNSKVDLTQLKHYYMVDNILMTHAGLSNEFYNAYNHNERQVGSFLWNMVETNKERLYDCSSYRGGKNAFGGILWCDYDEFVPIKGVRQIFGHTNDEKVRCKDTDNFCIDTFGTTYATIEDGGISIKSGTFKLELRQ